MMRIPKFLLLCAATMAVVLGMPGQAVAGWGDETWGTMIWGESVSVPGMPGLGLIILAVALSAAAARLLRRRRPAFGLPVLLVLLSVPLVVAAGTLAVPNTFVNGEVADADQVNANFDAVETEVNDNATDISDETTARTAADVAHDAAISTNATAISDETTARTAADVAHDAAISANATAVSDETTARTAADVAHDAAISTNAADISSIEGADLTRFEVCADAQTIADHQTGLLWEKKVGSLGSGDVLGSRQDVNETYSWCEPDPSGAPSCSDSIENPPTGTAFTDFVATLNDANSGTASTSAALTGCLAGVCDWRLPSIGELTSLLDSTCASGAPCIVPGFVDAEGIAGAGGATALSYWSASGFTGAPEYAWIVDFSIGAPGGGAYLLSKSEVRAARAVRRGSCIRDVGERITYPKRSTGCWISCGPNSAPNGGSCNVPSTCQVTCPKGWLGDCNCNGIGFCNPAQCSCILPGPSSP